eukprot:13428513-Alexandrium_andersonii.AAC.1
MRASDVPPFCPGGCRAHLEERGCPAGGPLHHGRRRRRSREEAGARAGRRAWGLSAAAGVVAHRHLDELGAGRLQHG